MSHLIKYKPKKQRNVNHKYEKIDINQNTNARTNEYIPRVRI